MRPIFITGGTGYIGKRTIPILLQQGYAVTALVRQQSRHKIPAGCIHVLGDPFNAAAYVNDIAPGNTFIHLYYYLFGHQHYPFPAMVYCWAGALLATAFTTLI